MATEDSTPSMLPEWAKSPFDNSAADTILHTSDSIHFRVHSIILSEASPFFREMFALPQRSEGQAQQEGSQSYYNGRPVISVAEDSATLDALLRLCYPVIDPELSDIERVRAVLTAALKYQMDHAAVVSTRALQTFAPKQPVRIWAIACKLQLEDVARYAASLTVTDRRDISTAFPEETKELSAGHYFRLLQYHRRQGKVPGDFKFLSPSRDSQQPETFTFDVKSFLSTTGETFPDLICRASDGVEFPTHKAILAMASPVLRALIASLSPSIPRSVPGEPEPASSRLPCLSLQEDGKTLADLLHLCYPVRWPTVQLPRIDAARNLVAAARKYEMQSVQELVADRLDALVETQPLAAYFTAVHLDLPYHAKLAAKRLLEEPITDAYVSEMEAAPAPAYYRLLRYHAAACDAVAGSLATLQNTSHRSLNCPQGWLQNVAEATPSERNRYSHGKRPARACATGIMNVSRGLGEPWQHALVLNPQVSSSMPYFRKSSPTRDYAPLANTLRVAWLISQLPCRKAWMSTA